MKCSKCNAEIADNAKFCTVCGAKVEPEIKCPNCGAIVGKDAKFCTECGCKIELERKCPKCGTKVYDGNKFCTNCGAKIDAGSDDNGIPPLDINNNIENNTFPREELETETVVLQQANEDKHSAEVNNCICSQAEPTQTSELILPSQVPSVENCEPPKKEINPETVVPQPTEIPCNTQNSSYESDSFDAMAYESAISNIYKNAICVIFVLWGISVVFSLIPYANIISGIISLVCFGFYIYYIVCLGRLIKVVHSNDVSAIKKLQLSSIIFALLPVVAIVCSLVLSAVMSSAGIYDFSSLNAAAIVIIIIFTGIIISAIALRIISFVKLKKSETFLGKQGANILFIASIILAICPFLSIIGGLIGVGNIGLYLILLVGLVPVIMTFIGWKRIKEAAELEISKEKENEDETKTIICPNKTCGKEVNAKFEECPFCGTPLHPQETSVEN